MGLAADVSRHNEFRSVAFNGFQVDPPVEDSHLHFDVRFLVLAMPDAVPVGNHESEALRWVPFDDLADLGVDDGLLRMARTARGLGTVFGC